MSQDNDQTNNNDKESYKGDNAGSNKEILLPFDLLNNHRNRRNEIIDHADIKFTRIES